MSSQVKLNARAPDKGQLRLACTELQGAIVATLASAIGIGVSVCMGITL